mmetsp:Transcript_31830/g.56976  ORF Transcript_31830/g.56976 Transcript_31830/m.56976 type:complete len:241 (-) Transcript_31830:46-768(-)
MVLYTPSSVATLPITSATRKSTFSGSSTAVEYPSSSSTVPGGSPASRMAARANFAASGSASIAKTLRAPALAAAMARSAKGPVPMSTQLSLPPSRPIRRRMASTNFGVRSASSRIEAYDSNEKSVPRAKLSVAHSVSSPKLSLRCAAATDCASVATSESASDADANPIAVRRRTGRLAGGSASVQGCELLDDAVTAGIRSIARRCPPRREVLRHAGAYRAARGAVDNIFRSPFTCTDPPR